MVNPAKKQNQSINSVVMNASAEDFDSDESKIFELVNEERQKRNLNSLVWDDDVASLARNYSKQMAKDNFFDHFDSSGGTVVERAEKSKLKKWSKIGENLFSCDGAGDFNVFAVKKWMKSPSHRENILDKDWTTAGIGIAESSGGEIFITQVFIQR